MTTLQAIPVKDYNYCVNYAKESLYKNRVWHEEQFDCYGRYMVATGVPIATFGIVVVLRDGRMLFVDKEAAFELTPDTPTLLHTMQKGEYDRINRHPYYREEFVKQMLEKIA